MEKKRARPQNGRGVQRSTHDRHVTLYTIVEVECPIEQGRLEANVLGMSTRRRHAGRRVRDAIAVFEKNEGTIVFTAEGGQPPLKSPASSRRSPTSPDSTEQSERTPVPPTGSTGGQQSLRNARSVGEWTKEKVYVLELTRGRADDQAERQLRSGPVKTGGSGKDTSVDKKQVFAVRVCTCALPVV